jgi:hypothetical protein
MYRYVKFTKAPTGEMRLSRTREVVGLPLINRRVENLSVLDWLGMFPMLGFLSRERQIWRGRFVSDVKPEGRVGVARL